MDEMGGEIRTNRRLHSDWRYTMRFSASSSSIFSHKFIVAGRSKVFFLKERGFFFDT